MELTDMDARALLATDPSTAGIIVDFDGTLSPIVDRPEDAVPADGAPDVLGALAERYALVAVLSGRPLDFLRSRFPPSRVLLCGAYGRERSDRHERHTSEGLERVVAAAVAATSHLDGVLVERKGAGVALHYRLAPERAADVDEIALVLAQEFELEVMPGRLVVELVVPGPKKGDAVRRLVHERGLRSVLVAGDDIADVASFDVVRELDVASIAIAVMSEEAPQRLIDAADGTVKSPEELVDLLRELL
jgi:trehalose 6-phosphate phosphatase